MKAVHYTMIVLGALVAPMHQIASELPAWAPYLNAAAGAMTLALTVLAVVSQSAISAPAPVAAAAAAPASAVKP